MTDNTQPDAGSTHIIRYALEMGLLWIDGDGRNKVREALDALDILEAQLSSSGFTAADMATAAAQGFRDGVASLAANAGEPVAHLWQHGETGRTRVLMPDMIVDADASWRLVGPLFLGSPRSPPEGMAGWKWVPVEPTEEMLAAAHDGDREYTLRNFGDVMTVMQGPYDHWAAMIAAAPHPPTTSAGSKGE